MGTFLYIIRGNPETPNVEASGDDVLYLDATNLSYLDATHVQYQTYSDTDADGKQVFLWIGNSIAAGTGVVANTLPASGTAYEYDRTTSTILEYGAGAQVTLFSRNQYCPAAKFCIDYNADTGFKPVIVNRAAGASYVSPETTNNWQTSGTNYNDAVIAANACLAALGLTRLKGILIADILVNDIQGIQSIPTASVGTYYTTFINNLRADFPNVPIHIGVPGRGVGVTTSTRMTTIRNFIRQSVENYSNVYIGCSLTAFAGSGLYLADNIHPTDVGRDYLGAMLARSIKNAAYPKWARSIISCHFHELTTTQKNKIRDFINTWKYLYLSAEYMYLWKGFANGSRANSNFDWTFLSGPTENAGHTISADSHIATNGTNQYFDDGHNQLNSNLYVTQNDLLQELKIKTFPTTANKKAFGAGLVYLGHNASNVIHYGVSSGDDTYTGEASLTAGSWVIKTDSGTISLYKDGVLVDTLASTSSTLRSLIGFVGAYNNDGVTQNYSNAEFERHIKIKQSAVLHVDELVSALNTVQQ